jgi:hypothetical protein
MILFDKGTLTKESGRQSIAIDALANFTNGRPSMISKYLAAIAATALVAAPVAAAPANPAAKLSLSKSVRAGSVSAKKDKAVAGFGLIFALLGAAAVVAGVVVIADGDDSDSN